MGKSHKEDVGPQLQLSNCTAREYYQIIRLPGVSCQDSVSSALSREPQTIPTFSSHWGQGIGICMLFLHCGCQCQGPSVLGQTPMHQPLGR